MDHPVLLRDFSHKVVVKGGSIEPPLHVLHARVRELTGERG